MPIVGCFIFLCILAAFLVAAFYVVILGAIAISFIVKWMAIIGVVAIAVMLLFAIFYKITGYISSFFD